MPEARTLNCPNCGGATAEGSRTCQYCRAPVATVRCARCYHMNVPDAVCCSGCGATLGLEPVGAPDELACSACQNRLDVFEGGGGKLWDCSQCGGQFVEHALLRELIERREAYGGAVPRRVKRWSPPVGPVRYVPCPLCTTLMTRRNFGSSSGVIVDVCTDHGIWFDIGELPRILAFVETGGLAQARRRELANLEAARSRPAPTGALPALSNETESPTHLTDHVLRLLGTIGDLINGLKHSDSAH